MQQSERTYSSGYRFGFGGQEKDDEVKGEGNSYTAEYWEYDSRLGRRWNVDPITKPWESSYAAFANNPIYYNDPNGADVNGDGTRNDGSKEKTYGYYTRGPKKDPGIPLKEVEVSAKRTFKDKLRNEIRKIRNVANRVGSAVRNALSTFNPMNFLPNVITYGGNGRGGRGGRAGVFKYNAHSIWNKITGIWYADMGVMEDILGVSTIIRQGNSSNDGGIGRKSNTNSNQRTNTESDKSTKNTGNGFSEFPENETAIKVQNESSVQNKVQSTADAAHGVVNGEILYTSPGDLAEGSIVIEKAPSLSGSGFTIHVIVRDSKSSAGWRVIESAPKEKLSTKYRSLIK